MKLPHKVVLAMLHAMAVCLVIPAYATTETERRNGSDANIYGHVIDSLTGKHIPYVTIAIEGTTMGCVTDATGHYFLKNIPEGRWSVEASSLGYKTVTREINAVAGKSIEINFTLHEDATMVDEVVVSATRNETNRKKTATVVNVMSGKLFESTASSTLSESMNFQSGLRVENNCGNCGTMQLRINGLEGQYSQILLDSRPIFSSLAAVYGLDQLPVAMVERVEVIRGGGSALFGSNAIGGVVNIITKDPLRNSLSISNTTNIIEDGTPDFNTALNGSFVSSDGKAGVYLFGQIKERQAYDRNDDGFSDIPKLNSETAGFRAYYKTSPYSRITAEYHHTHEFRRGGDNMSEAPHMALICEQLDHKINGGGLRFDYFSADMRHRASVYSSVQGIDRNSYFGTDMNPDAYGKTSDLTAVAGAQYTYEFHKLFFMPAELTVGGEYSYNYLNDYYIATERRLRQTTHTAGIFAQNEWKSDKLNILIGARIDKHNMIDRIIVSPRANIRYSPIEEVGLRLSYSSGYRAPQAYNEDLHIDALNHTVSLIRLADDLRPEYSHSLSASADMYHNFGRVQANLLVEGFLYDHQRRLHARKGRRIRRRGHQGAPQRLGRDSRRNNCRDKDRHTAHLRDTGRLHVPAQPLQRAGAMVRRCRAAETHVPFAGPLRLHHLDVRHSGELQGFALRNLYRPDARPAQQGNFAVRHPDTHPVVLRHRRQVRIYGPHHRHHKP